MAHALHINGLRDLLHNPVGISQNLFIAEADHLITLSTPPLRSPLVSLLIAGLRMVNPVDFHDQSLYPPSRISMPRGGPRGAKDPL